jgi:hypothetical protein
VASSGSAFKATSRTILSDTEVSSMATGPGGSGHSGFTMLVMEAVDTTVAKEVADAAAAKETTVE